MKTFSRLGAIAAGAAVVLAAALPAQAATGLAASSTTSSGSASSNSSPGSASGAGLSAAKSLTTARIDGRLATLRALQLAVNSAQYLTSADKSALSSLLSSDISGLDALQTKVSGESTVAAVRADATAMVDDYRVYLLVAPKVRLTDAFDIESAAATKLQQVHDSLAAKVAGLPGGGTSQERSQLADLQTQLSNAEQAVDGKVTTLLAIQPGPDGSSITAELKTLVASARTARADLRQARTDAQDLVNELK